MNRKQRPEDGRSLGRGLVMQVIPPAMKEGPDLAQLISMMQGLALSVHEPVALEIAGTPGQRSLLVRATTAVALEHVRRQLLSCYPQAGCRALSDEDDPLYLAATETVTACELRLAAASFVPLRTWERRTHSSWSPIGGLLAGLDGLPEGMRAVCQLTLVPASPQWSRVDQRTAFSATVEAAQAREQQQRRSGQRAPSTTSLLLGAILLLAFWLSPQYFRLIPSWAGPTVEHLARGEVSAVPLVHQVLVYGVVLALLLVGIGGRWLLGLLVRCFRAQPLYARRTIEHQMMQMAYRVRLRLYVIGPATSTWRSHPLRVGVWTHRNLLWRLAARASLPQRGWSHIHFIVKHWWRFSWLLLRLSGSRLAGFLAKERHWRWDWWRMSCDKRLERKAVLARLVACYRQYHLASGNYFVPHRCSRRTACRLLTGASSGLLSGGHGWWQGVRTSRQLLSAEEIVHLWHLPSGHVLSELAQVERRQARSFLLPSALATGEGAGPLLGYSEHAGHVVPVHLPADVFHAHLFIGGKTGEGKSTALVHLGAAAMQQGGVVVVDPHGDLIEQLLRLVPSHRASDVVLLDLSDREYVVGLNPLDVTLGRGRDKTVADLLTAFAQIWASSWGSRMESVFEYALRTLYEANEALCRRDPHLGPSRQYTLLDVLPLLTDESFCHALLEEIQQVDPYLVRWWYLYYDALNTPMQRDRSDPVLSKVARFESYIARRIVGQSNSTIDIASCIRQEQIVLVKLAKGVVGEEIAHLLGATILSLIHQALEEQGSQTETTRKRMLLMIDEFQLLTGVDWAALAELRKYGATFALATQSLAVLKERHAALLALVFASIKQWIVFHLSAPDAELVARDLDVESQDIVHLERYSSYVKWLSQERRHATFSLRWALPPAGREDIALLIREQARRRDARPVERIDEKLTEALIRAQATQPHNKETWQPGQTPSRSSAEDLLSSSPTPSRDLPPVGKYRGRRAQEKRAARTGTGHLSSAQASLWQPPTTPQPMNWQETVGTQGRDEHTDQSGEAQIDKQSIQEEQAKEETNANHS